ncbi:MAG: GHKL domain-containing protein [Magnetococcales bacterium]|nr:GHKL domain-containing protein [Magnetococcales bacterium]
MTAASLQAEYVKTSNTVQNQLAQLQLAFEQSLSQAVWRFDQEQITSILFGIQKNLVISGVTIHDPDGRSLGRMGVGPRSEANYPIVRLVGALTTMPDQGEWGDRSFNQFRFPLSHHVDGVDQKLGEVLFYWDQEIILKEVRYEFVVLILGALVKTLALWIIFVYFERSMLKAPLRTLIEATQLLEVEKLDDANLHIPTRNYNEFNILAEVFNRMAHKLGSSYQTIRERNRALKESYTLLEAEMAQRKGAEEEARCRREELAHAHRTHTMGAFASGLAHELSQPLTSISLYAGTAILRLQSGQLRELELVEALKTIKSQAIGVGDLIKNLKRFLRKGEINKAITDLDQLGHAAIDFILPEAKRHGITVNCQLSGEEPLIYVDAIQIQQVIVNLVRNSMEAMAQISQKRGKLILTTAVLENRSVELTVRDTGPGICEADSERIFERFYTTKPQGMGLGLSLVQNIITEHSGQFWLKNHPEGGAIAGFSLPRIKENTQ